VKSLLIPFAVVCLFLAAVGVGAGETPLTVTCKKMGGAVQFKALTEAGNFCAMATYPKPLKALLGGFKDGGKTFGPDLVVYLDTDANAKTGLKGGDFDPGAKGAEWKFEAQEISTSLAKDDKGEWINGQKLDAAITKGDDYPEMPEGYYPEWQLEVGGKFQNADWTDLPDSKAIRLCAPLSFLGLKAGQKVRIVGVVPLCNDAFPFPGVTEATITLN